MSIELGRGVKRGARERDEDVSSNHVFQLGNDSLYEVTQTPPIRPSNGPRKSNDELRRQASIRRATESTKGVEATNRATTSKHRSLSEALHRIASGDETSFMAEDAAHQTATFNTRNTRFARSRQTSANEPSRPTRFTSGSASQTPRRAVTNNATAQSNSFALPDLPNITELVSGVRKDGTPLFDRNTKSRSRFASNSHKPATRHEHHSIEGIPVPDEEKAIYASLQLLKDRVDQLELEKSEAAKRAEEYEGEIIDLRSQLAVSQRRPDSGLGSPDEDEMGSDRLKVEKKKKKLQASVKALQDRLDRSLRKISVFEIAVKRITKERDELITQIGVAYYSNEELKAEKETLEDVHQKMVSENEELKDEVDALRKENQDLRVLMDQTQRSYAQESSQRMEREAILRNKMGKRAQTAQEIQNATREILESKQRSPKKVQSGQKKTADLQPGTKEKSKSKRRFSLGFLDDITSDDIAVRVAQEVRKHREAATAKAETQDFGHGERETRQHQAVSKDRSTLNSRQRKDSNITTADRAAAASRHGVPTTVDVDASDAESTTQLDFTGTRRNAAKRASLPSPAKSAVVREEDGRDLTLLSIMDVNELHKLRKKLEEERKAGRLSGRATSAPNAMQNGVLPLPRKSSLKDIGAGSESGTGRFNFDEVAKAAKCVRLQSPHTSDDYTRATQQETELRDVSFASNTSRRRHRRAASAEGLTSAFILPDITFHNSQGNGNIQHDTGNCTACPPSGEKITIPSPVPVTDRPEDVADVTNATIRPSQPPPVALATVIKQLQDEIVHLKLQLAAQQRLYNQHDPALSKRRRHDVKTRMDKLTAGIEHRSDQVYALYDVVEGQKEAAERVVDLDDVQVVEETLQSLGIDPAELSGKIGRSGPPLGFDGADDISEDALPWEGLSDEESEMEAPHPARRRSGVFEKVA